MTGSGERALAGIDAGATLWKLALLREDLEIETFPAGAVDRMRSRLGEWRPESVQVTGGGGAQLAAVLGFPVGQVSEFDAWPRGAAVLAGRAGWSLPPRHLLVS